MPAPAVVVVVPSVGRFWAYGFGVYGFGLIGLGFKVSVDF